MDQEANVPVEVGTMEEYGELFEAEKSERVERSILDVIEKFMTESIGAFEAVDSGVACVSPVSAATLELVHMSEVGVSVAEAGPLS